MKKNKEKSIISFSIILMIIIFVGVIYIYNNNNIQIEKDSLSEKSVAAVVLLDNQVEKLCQASMNNTAQKYGMKVFEGINEGELTKETDLLKRYIEGGVDGICIRPVSDKSSLEMLKNAAEKGVKISLINSDITEDWVVSSTKVNQYQVGELVGESCAKYIKEKFSDREAKIAIIQSKALNTKISQLRISGFLSKTDRLIDIVEDIDAWTLDDAVESIEELIYAHPDLDIIFCANECATVGAVFAIRNTGVQMSVFGMDITEQTVNMLVDDENILQALGGYDTVKLGERAMESLCLALQGQNCNSTTVLPGILLTRAEGEAALEYAKEIFASLE